MWFISEYLHPEIKQKCSSCYFSLLLIPQLLNLAANQMPMKIIYIKLWDGFKWSNNNDGDDEADDIDS